MLLKILLAGDGGQGVQTIAEIIFQAAFAKNWEVSLIPNYGLEQRGGVSLAFFKISNKQISYPKFSTADVLVILSSQAKNRTTSFVDTGTKILDYVDFYKKNKTLAIAEKSLNVFILGLLSKQLEEKNILDWETVFSLLEKKLKNKTNWEENKVAFQLGKKFIS